MEAQNLFTPNRFVVGSLVGLDGNAYTLLSYFRKQATRANWPVKDIEIVLSAAVVSDYAHLTTVLSAHLQESEN